jgi:hypothetical protein
MVVRQKQRFPVSPVSTALRYMYVPFVAKVPIDGFNPRTPRHTSGFLAADAPLEHFVACAMLIAS